MDDARRAGIFLGLGLLVLASCVGPFPDKKRAEVIYTSANVYTGDAKQPWAEAFAIRDGMFMVVGSNGDAVAVAGGGTVIRDLGGRTVVPGLIDVENPSSGTLTTEQVAVLRQAARRNNGTPTETAHRIGSIRRKALASFIVLDRNLFELRIEELEQTQVDKTVVAGEVVFDRLALGDG